MNEARRHERKAVSLRPRYRVATRLDYTESPCLDLSEGGMFIESSEPAEPGTLIKVECGGENGAFRALGSVAWRRLGGDAPSGMGIRFLKLDPGGGEGLRTLIAQGRPIRSSAAVVALPTTLLSTWLTIGAVATLLIGAAIIFLGAR